MKNFLLMFALVCAVVNVSAQGNSRWSVKTGVGLTSLVGSGSDGVKYSISYKAGVGYEFALTEFFSIEPSLMLSNKSFKIENVEGTINRYYAELPVLAVYKIALGGSILNINAGPYLAYGLFGSDIEWIDNSKNVFDVCEKFEVGIQLGAKMDLGNWILGAEFTRAFTKSFKDFILKTYTQGFGLTLGYKF